MRVLIAEDHYLTREGTRLLLCEEEGLEVVGVAADYDSVLAEARRTLPDVVLMDIKMPPTHGMEGIEAAHVIKAERPGTGIVILSQHDDEGYVWALLAHGVTRRLARSSLSPRGWARCRSSSASWRGWASRPCWSAICRPVMRG
jgi:DNA-binding NarL/FixJ family response regulator